MELFGFLKRGRPPTANWQRHWEHAVEALDVTASARLGAELAERRRRGEDVELEEEMLQALDDVLVLERELEQGVWPALETSHRVAAGEPCHFSAAVSMPDDPAQPTGRLLLTSGRAAFAGGARTPALPWHAARDVLRGGRDLLFLRTAEDGMRFRCNTFSDALCGAAIARRL